MKYFSTFFKFLIVVFSLTAVSTQVEAQDQTWRKIYSLDFGGTSESDPVVRAELTAAEGCSTSLEYNDDTDPSFGWARGYYHIVKYAENKRDWWQGGDHTTLGNKNIGYFMAFDCPTVPGSSDNFGTLGYLNYPTEYLFQKVLTGVCSGVKLKFEAYFANLFNSEDATGTAITLAAYSSATSTEALWKSGYTAIKYADGGDTQLNWTPVTGIIDIPSTLDVSDGLYLKILPIAKDLSISAGDGPGYDFAMDDIAVYISQPTVNFGDVEFEYKKSATLTATTDLASFFADLSNLAYFWEYSADNGKSWTQVGGTRTYAQYPNFDYLIQSFDKNDQTGSGNGLYRLTIAQNDIINSITDETVCCIRDTFRIKETKNKMNMLICEEKSYTVDGTTITAKDTAALVHTPNDYEIKVSTIKHKLVVDTFDVCVGKVWTDGNIYTEVGLKEIGTPEVIKSVRVDNDGNVCDSITNSGMLNVTDGTYKQITTKVKDATTKLDRLPCVGDLISQIDKTYNEVGVFKDTIADPDNCVYFVYNSNVGPTYDQILEKTICEGEVYDGKTYNQSGDFSLSPVKYTTAHGCDSLVTMTLHVTSHTETALDDVELCQSEFGEGKTAYTFDGKNYYNDTKKDMVLNLTSTTSSKETGCDSITTVKVTIHPMVHVTLDTMICRDQILFGKVYTVAGNYTKDFSYTGSYGCDSIVTWNIKVLDIQLKLRAEFGASSICEGQSATLIVELTPSDANLSWEPELTSRNPLRPTVMPDETTIYVAHATNEAGCHATDSIEISVFPNPTLTVDSVYQQERKLEFSLEGGTPEYTYMIGNSEVTPTEGVLENLTYGKNAFRVTDANGCTAIDTFQLEPLPVDPGIIMTPNGDGSNDTWIIKNIDVYPTAMVRIYDRFGKLIYEQRGNYEDAPFDGTFKGEDLPSTDYWYEIDIDDIDKQYMGHFTLLR